MIKPDSETANGIFAENVVKIHVLEKSSG